MSARRDARERTAPRRNAIGLIARREIVTRMRSKSLYIITAIMVVGIIALGVVTSVTGGDDGPESWTVGVVDTDGHGDFADAVTAIGTAVDVTIVIADHPDDAVGREAVTDGDVDVLVDPASGDIVFDDTVDDAIVGVVQQAWSQSTTRTTLTDAGLSPDEVDAAFAVDALAVSTIDDDEESGVAILAGTMAAILLFISVQTFGTYVLTGVVEEKSTAVVEVLLVRTRASQLLAGKVLGIGAVALTQFVAVVAAAIVSLLIADTTIPSAVWSAVPVTVVWFLGGYLLYSTLFALAGSLVSRQEDAQAAAAPVSTLLIGAYIIIFIFGYVPDSMASRILSLVPFISPMLMPVRMAAGAASVVEIAAAVVLLAGTIWVIWMISSRIYEQVLLRRGSRISWKDAAGMLRR